MGARRAVSSSTCGAWNVCTGRFPNAAATLYKTDTTIEFLKKISQPVRVITLGTSDFPMAPNDANLAFDGLMAHGVRIVYGYHGNELGRFDQLAGKDNDRNFGNPTVWALTNAEFILANTDTIGGAGMPPRRRARQRRRGDDGVALSTSRRPPVRMGRARNDQVSRFGR